MIEGALASQALDALPLPFLVLDPVTDETEDDLAVEWANPAAVERFDVAVGTRLVRDAPLGPMAGITVDAERSRSLGQAVTVDRAIVRDDRTQHLRITLAPMGERTAMTVEDIASEITARADLEVAEGTLARVERWGNLGVWEIDLATGSVYWSTQVYEILGVDDQSFDGFLSVVHPDDRARIDHLMRRLVDQPGPYRVTHRVIRQDGTRTVDQHMQSVAGADGRPARILGTVIDVTASHAIEEHLVQVRGEGTLGLLAVGLAHDFKNLLTVVRGHAQVLLLDAHEPHVIESLQSIVRAGERASVLTRRLMTIGRRDDLRPTTVALIPVLDEIVRVLGPTMAPAIDLAVDDEAIPTATNVIADPRRLMRVMIDLVLNARDASASVVRLRPRLNERGEDNGATGARGDQVVIDVIDDGVGMDDEVAGRAFEPFFTTKPDTEGSGLGLAGARSFALQSSGDIQVSSVVGVGTTFSLFLPVARTGHREPRRRHTRIVIATAHDACGAEIAETAAALGPQTVRVDDIDGMMFCLDAEPIDVVVIDSSLPGATAWLATEHGVATVEIRSPVDHAHLRGRLTAMLDDQ